MLGDSLSRSQAAPGRLVALGEVHGFRLAPGEPDIRGWGLFGPSGVRLGTVEEILVDTATDEVRALVISKARLGMSPATAHVVFPIERVVIDVAQRAAISDVTAEAFDSLSEEDTRVTATRFAPAASATTGPAVTGRGSTTQTSATVERTADGEQVIKVPIVEEQLVVERRPVVKEVVVIRKRAVEGSQTIDADLRKERLEVDRTDAGGRRRVE